MRFVFLHAACLAILLGPPIWCMYVVKVNIVLYGCTQHDYGCTPHLFSSYHGFVFIVSCFFLFILKLVSCNPEISSKQTWTQRLIITPLHCKMYRICM